jgi:hypothetical protein
LLPCRANTDQIEWYWYSSIHGNIRLTYTWDLMNRKKSLVGTRLRVVPLSCSNTDINSDHETGHMNNAPLLLKW